MSGSNIKAILFALTVGCVIATWFMVVQGEKGLSETEVARDAPRSSEQESGQQGVQEITASPLRMVLKESHDNVNEDGVEEEAAGKPRLLEEFGGSDGKRIRSIWATIKNSHKRSGLPTPESTPRISNTNAQKLLDAWSSLDREWGAFERQIEGHLRSIIQRNPGLAVSASSYAELQERVAERFPDRAKSDLVMGYSEDGKYIQAYFSESDGGETESVLKSRSGFARDYIAVERRRLIRLFSFD